MTKPPAPTSRDVARALGIAQSTVSRAFTPGAPISEALRTRIHAAAAVLGYRPNLLARGLIAGRSRLIGVLIAPQTNLLYPELLYELGRRLAAEDHQLLLCPAADEAAAARAVARLQAFRVDAVLATGVLGEAEARALADELPLVTFNRLMTGVAGVSCDFAAIGRALAAQMLAAGRRRIALIVGPSGSWVSAEFARGAGERLGARAAVATVAADYAYAAAAEALATAEARLGAAPDGLLCVNDQLAAGCLDRLEAVCRVPEEVALATVARARPAEAPPRVAGMRQPMEAMIDVAVAMLLRRWEGAEHAVLAPLPEAGRTLP